MTDNRRFFLKNTLNYSSLALLLTCGLCVPRQCLSSSQKSLNEWHLKWNKNAFTKTQLPEAIQAVTGTDLTQMSEKIHLDISDKVSPGMISLSVTAELPDVKQISLYSEQSPQPLLAIFDLDNQADAFVATRLKLTRSITLVAVVTSNGKQFSQRKKINVIPANR